MMAQTASSFKNYLALTKPRLVLMAAATAVVSCFLGSQEPFPVWRFLHLFVGAALVGGGANALNQYWEREIDSKMKRTEKRPIPSGKLKAKEALYFGWGLSVGGIFYLGIATNPLTGLMGFLTLMSYVFLYTPLKQKTSLNTYVGAFSGAMPCLIGWTAARNTLQMEAYLLFLILFFWQLPHFLAIAWIYREDYKNAGLRMLSTSDPTGKKTAAQLFWYSIVLFAASLLPTLSGLAGLLYLTAAIFSGLFLLALVSFISTHRLIYAKPFVTASIFYLATLNIFLLLDKG